MKKFMLLILISVWLALEPTALCQNESGISQSDPASPPKDPTSQSEWHVSWVPAYLWLSGVNGNVGVARKTVPVNARFVDVFDKLNIGYMTAVDIRRKRVGLLADFQYLDLSSDEISTPFGKLYSSAHIDAQQYIFDPEIYGRVFESRRGFVDALGGVRYWHLISSLDLRPGLLPAFHASATQNWVDPVMGGRFRLNLGKGLFLMLKGDAGGFGAGSQETWQIYTGLGKDFKRRYSAFAGYRRLSVNYRNGAFVYDANMNGSLLGLNVRFR